MAIDMRAVRVISVENGKYTSEGNRYAVQIARGGQPIPAVQSDRILSVEEEVMQWHGANHIHGWFVANVQNGKSDGGRYRVSTGNLRLLLEVCEKVLNSSQIVWEPAFTASSYEVLRNRMDSQGAPPKAIRNVASAHKLLPTRSWDHSGANEYNEAYLKHVEATRDWAERMLTDELRGVPGTIYYSAA